MNIEYIEGKCGAIFSNCESYRYCLWRTWDDSKPSILFIGLNPSVADEKNDDRTICKVVKFANDWGYGSVYMMNLFAFITPYPKKLSECEDPIGENDKYLKEYADQCQDVLFAWGGSEMVRTRSEVVKKMFPNAKALIINKNGTPRHPLYVKADTIPIPYN